MSNYLGKPFEIYDRIYIKDYGDGKQKRMYYTDKELLELDINKKNFDTLALQRELSNRGYKLPKSTKKDGDFDGIWGDETKNALLDYQAKNTVHKIKQDEFIKHYNGGKLDNHTNINMKYNKEKTKKFASGGKTPKEIMEEARRNQAIERQAQARDAVRTSGIAAYQPTPVTIQAPRQEVVLKEYAPSKPISFSQAFGEARKAGLKEFTWRGKRYTTELAGTSEDNTTYDGGVLSEVEIFGSRPGKTTQRTDSTTVVSQNPLPERGGVKDEIKNIGRDWSQVQAPNINYGTIRADHRPKRIDWGWLRRKPMGLNQGSILYQQGGQLHLRNVWEKYLV